MWVDEAGEGFAEEEGQLGDLHEGDGLHPSPNQLGPRGQLGGAHREPQRDPQHPPEGAQDLLVLRPQAHSCPSHSLQRTRVNRLLRRLVEHPPRHFLDEEVGHRRVAPGIDHCTSWLSGSLAGVAVEPCFLDAPPQFPAGEDVASKWDLFAWNLAPTSGSWERDLGGMRPDGARFRYRGLQGGAGDVALGTEGVLSGPSALQERVHARPCQVPNIAPSLGSTR